MDAAMDTPMADVNGWGWQGSSKTIRERTAYMLDHSPIPCNVKFKVFLPGKNAVTIGAHKDVLAIGSEVFLAMFYGDLANNHEIIDIPDTDPTAFGLMMRFLYTEEISIAPMENDIVLAFEVLKCAGKYGVPYLYTQCRQWILQHIARKFADKEHVKSNALSYLRTAMKAEYNDPIIKRAMWGVIDVCAESVLLTPDDVLRHVSLDILTKFSTRDSLNVMKEKHLYDFMIRWAKLQTLEEDTTGLILRERLGDALKIIRYTQMDISEFSNGPVADGVLTYEEAVQVYRHNFAPVAEKQFSFISRPRKGIPPPRILTVHTKLSPGVIFEEANICIMKPFAKFTMQMAELHPDLLEHLQQYEAGPLVATWSCAENSGSLFSTLTAHVGDAFEDMYWTHFGKIGDAALKVLKESKGQTVDLGLGDVAMEVQFSKSETTDVHRTETISLIFGGYSGSTYSSRHGDSSVFHLGRIVSGPTDFSFLRHFVKLDKLLPVSEEWWFMPDRTL